MTSKLTWISLKRIHLSSDEQTWDADKVDEPLAGLQVVHHFSFYWSFMSRSTNISCPRCLPGSLSYIRTWNTWYLSHRRSPNRDRKTLVTVWYMLPMRAVPSERKEVRSGEHFERIQVWKVVWVSVGQSQWGFLGTGNFKREGGQRS